MSTSSIQHSIPTAMTATSAPSTTTSTSTSSSSASTNSTFMTLLLTELQSQDPTAPMDTTAMVGQMVSLNQLDQLMSIQSILQNSLGSGATAASSGIPTATDAIARSTPPATASPISNTQTTYGVN